VRAFLRIAYLIINHNKREGTSKAIAEVAERMAQRHEVHVFSRTAEGVNLSGMQWHRVPGPSYPHVAEFLGYVLPCAVRVRRSRFDIIHAAGSVSTAADIYTIQNIQPAKRTVLRSLEKHEHAGLARRITRLAYLRVTSAWERWAYERSKPRRPMFLPVSTGVARELKAFYRVGDAPCRIIPNAADILRFKPVTDRETIRRRMGLCSEDFVCAFSGGEWRRKGLDLAIQALALVADPRVKLLVLGRDDAAPEFETLARQCGAAKQVVFAGFQKNVEEPLACADLFLFPSRYEAFSLATLEAAACGLPILAPRINGAEDFIQPGVNGEFIEHAASHIASVLQSLASDVSRCRTMGKAGRRLVEEQYTWDRVAAMTEQAYHEVLERKGACAAA